MQDFISWLKERLADSQLTVLLAFLLLVFTLLMLFGKVLAPVLLAIAFAYVLEDVVQLFCRLQMPRLLAISIVGIGALLLFLLTVLTVVPLLADQVVQLVGRVPQYVSTAHARLLDLHHQYAGWINPEYLQQIAANAAGKLQEWGAALLSFSLSSIPGLITLLVYMVLVPVLVFFLLKDKELLIRWADNFIPRDRHLLQRVWSEVDIQIGNYIRGKFWESAMVGVAMWVAYGLMHHEYALLLATLTGLSVWIPFIGAAVVTVPVVLLSFLQWGWSDTAFYGLAAYTVIQVIDANVIVPWLFSEVVNLHPIAIVVAVLVFGSLWGVLGVFIAIPMAALVQSVLTIFIERKSAVEATAD